MRGIDLGNVAFGLSADTAGLDRALGKLHAFGLEVNKVARSSEEGSAAMAAALAKQERLLASNFQKVTDLNRAIRQAGAPSQQISGLTVSYRALTDALTKGEISSIQYGRAQTQIAARLNESRRALADWVSQNQRAMSISKAWDMAYAEDARRTQTMGRVQAVATGIDASRTQTMGRAQSSAQAMDEARTRRMALLQMQAQTEDTLRSQGKWHEALHNLGRAVVLVEGPLSGLGARMTVLSALFESSAMKMALFIAGAATAAAGLGYAAVAAVKATIQWQQWEATMVAASGSATLVAEDMEYIIKQSNKFGMSLSSTIPAWTNFATAARLSGMSVDEQRTTFEAFMTAGSALHWSVQSVGRAFLALEQIMSKGKPQMQEVRLQLGQVLPGAFAIAARGMKMHTAELSKAMEQGKIDAKDFVLALSDATEKAYRAASVQGRTSITSDLQRFNNQAFLLSKSFDDATKSSNLFHVAVRAISGGMEVAAKNMQLLINASIALATGAFVAALPAMATGVIWVANALRTATMAALGLGTALSATPIGIIVRLGAAAASAALMFNMLAESKDKALAGADEYGEKLKTTIDGLEDIGSVDERVKGRLLKQNEKVIKGLDDEIAKVRQVIEAYKAQQAAPKTAVGKLGLTESTYKGPKTSLDEYNKAIAKQIELYTRKQTLEGQMGRLNKLDVTGDDPKFEDIKKINDFLDGITVKVDHINDAGSEYLAIMASAEKFAMKNAEKFGGWASDKMVAFLNQVSAMALPIKEHDEQKTRDAVTKTNMEEHANQAKHSRDAIDALNRTYGEANKQLEAEYQTLGKSKDEREIILALRTREHEALKAYTAAMKVTDVALREMHLKEIEDAKKGTDAYIEGLRKRQAAEKDWLTGAQTAIQAYIDEVYNAAKASERLFANAFRSIEDYLTDMVMGAEISLGNLTKAIGRDIVRSEMQRAVTGPLAVAAKESGGLLGGIKSLFGFANGGSFTVGGAGGTDSQVVAFKATPGEEVSIRTPGQQSEGGVTIQQYIYPSPGVSMADLATAMVQAKNAAVAEIVGMRRRGAF